MEQIETVLWVTKISQAILDQGYCKAPQLNACVREWRLTGEQPQPSALMELLVARGILSPDQVQRVEELAEHAVAIDHLPGYELLERIGVGATGQVFRARQTRLNRIVAIKILYPPRDKSKDLMRKLTQEARAVAGLNHKNIVQAYDVEVTDDLQYFVMELVQGTTVHQYLVQHKRYREPEALQIAIQVAEALQHAHAVRLIHCDVKPRNILIDQSGTAKLTDFGIARRLDESNAVAGGGAFGTPSPLYSSPEQFTGQAKIDGRTDIYSLGATLYHMVTGRPPFEASSYLQVARAHISEPLLPPDQIVPELSLGLCQVIDFMMAKRPEQRYSDVSKLLEDLRDLAASRAPGHATQGAVFDRALRLESAVDDPPTPPHTFWSWLPLNFDVVVWMLLVSLVFNLIMMWLLIRST